MPGLWATPVPECPGDTPGNPHATPPGDAVPCSAQTGKAAPCLGHQNTGVGGPAEPRPTAPEHQEAVKRDEEPEGWGPRQAAAGRSSDLTKNVILR